MKMGMSIEAMAPPMIRFLSLVIWISFFECLSGMISPRSVFPGKT